jgi:hypothetical protein
MDPYVDEPYLSQDPLEIGEDQLMLLEIDAQARVKNHHKRLSRFGRFCV